MMLITRDQMTRFDAAVLDAFTDRLADFVRERCGAPHGWQPALVPEDPAELRRQVRAHLARAQGYGIRDQDALAVFVSLAFSYSPRFDSLPGAHALLRDEARTPDERVFSLLDVVVAAERRRRIPAHLQRR